MLSIGSCEPRIHVEYVTEHSDEQPGQNHPSARAPQTRLPAGAHTERPAASARQPVCHNKKGGPVPLAETEHQVHRTLNKAQTKCSF